MGFARYSVGILERLSELLSVWIGVPRGFRPVCPRRHNPRATGLMVINDPHREIGLP